MGKPTGFMEFERLSEAYDPVEQRLKHYKEFVHTLSDDDAKTQGARCMDCGIPFCNNGCPVNNIIPDWNDLVFRGNWKQALEVLHSTNNFPDFTGRICPAPCEAACTLTINAAPVGIKSIEHFIIDKGWEMGWVLPQPPKSKTGKKIAIVGSGPAGLAAAQQLARAGHAVTLYERSDAIGGLLRYGIPDFKLEKHHIDRRLEQLAAEGVTFVTGCHVGVDVSGEALRAENDAVVLTCGALDPRDVGDTPGRHLGGIHLALDYLESSNRVQAGTLAEPTITGAGKHVIVLGGGDTAADCLGTAHRHGATSVHLIEVMPEPPGVRDPDTNPWPTWPMILRTASAHEEGGTRIFGSAVQEFIGNDEGQVRAVRVVDVQLQTQGGFRVEVPGTERELPADLILLAIGFGGTEPGPLLGQFGLDRNPRGTIASGSDWQTDVPGVFVAGDMRRGPSLIVWAIAEGRSAAAAVHTYLGGLGRLPSPVTPASKAIGVR